ncbi:MAG: phosphoserine phosphatase RsbU/P [Desulfovibrionales bacterium]|nr:phosphoserine phosphatase RsbU/P [Desulfovibrionales bacterium]
MLRAAVGQAECVDSRTAARQAAAQALEELGGRTPGVLLLYAPSSFDLHAVLDEVRRAFPANTPLLGCTTGGEFSSAIGFSEDSVALLALASDRAAFSVGWAKDLASEPEKSIRECVSKVKAALAAPPTLCILLCAPPADVSARIVQAAGAALPNVPVYGGLAGASMDSLTRPRLFAGSEVMTEAAAMLLVSGPIRAHSTVTRSFEPLGLRAPAGESRGARLLRIGDMTALDFYRSQLGKHSEPALEFPLAVFDDKGRFTIRSPTSWSKDDGSILFTSPTPEGAMVQLCESTRRDMIRDTEQAVRACMESYGPQGPPAAALAFSCATRKQILGARIKLEQEMLDRLLPAGVPCFGFYTFGEIAPFSPGDPPNLHNGALVTLLLGPGEPRPATTSRADASDECSGDSETEDGLRRRINFLTRKLERSERYREELERTKELSGALMRKINRDIDEARLSIEHKNAIIKEALDLAQKVQASLLPQRGPDIPGIEVAGQSIPCQETGGDCFDYLAPDNAYSPLTIAVSDITGHGVAAALLMTTGRALLRMRASQGGEPAELATDVNRQLVKDVYDSGQFMSLALLQVYPEKKRMAFVRAGHDPMQEYDPKTGQFHEILGPGGFPLGVDPYAFYRQRIYPMIPGRLVILGTDGVWETHNPEGEMYGRARMREVIRQNASASCSDIVSAVLEDAARFRKDRVQEDDATLVVMRVLDSVSAKRP